MLKPMSLFLILFILIFGVWANLYMFKIMTWKVWLTGMCLPWLGFAFGCTLARLSGRPAEDTIAIAIETGVQNTGVSIFMLWFTFDHPLGDLAGRTTTRKRQIGAASTSSSVFVSMIHPDIFHLASFFHPKKKMLCSNPITSLIN